MLMRSMALELVGTLGREQVITGLPHTLIIQTILKPCIQLEEQRVAQAAASRVDPSLKPSHSSVSPLAR